MFTNVIGALTSVLPKYFIFGSYVPVLIFSFVNAGLLYLLSAWIRHSVLFALSVSSPLTIAVAFVATIVTAYVVTSINDFLRKTLEGKYGVWPSLLEPLFLEHEQARRDRLEQKYHATRRQRYVLERQTQDWQTELRIAASQGVTIRRRVVGYTMKDPAGRALDALRAEPGSPEELSPDRLAAAVNTMAHALEQFDVTIDVALASDYRDLLAIMSTVVSGVMLREYDNASLLATYFGTGTPAPTRMGNIAAAIQSYAVGLYGLDLTAFFSRLQSCLVKSGDKGYDIVLDAKTQLDFLVACCWFSGASTALWYTLLATQGGYLPLYFAVALAGPLATVAFYYLACENYLAYGEVVRACVDMNRFALLRALDIPLPASTRDERRIWGILSRATVSALENVELSYEHPKK